MTSHGRFPWATLVALTASIGSAGGAHSGATAPLTLADVARLSPAAQITTPAAALSAAQNYVKSHPSSDYVIGSGDSMLPQYRDGTLVILERPELWKLKLGQTAVFVSASGRMVAHVLVRRVPMGWVTMGLQNDNDDGEVLTNWNYLGVVVTAYQPTGSIVLCYAASARHDELAMTH